MSLPPASSPEDEDSTALIDVAWAKRVRSGALVLFWTILLSYSLANLAGFLLPFIGGSGIHLKWIQLIPTAAVWLLFAGAYALTTPLPSKRMTISSEWLRRAVRVLAPLKVAVRVVKTISKFTWHLPDTWWFVLPVFLVWPCAVIATLLYLISLSGRFGLDSLARGLRGLVVCYVLLVAIGLGGEIILTGETVLSSAAMYWSLGRMAFGLAIWVWGLFLLRRFARHLSYGAEGRCVACGYSLEGLPSPRCPECGQTVQFQPET